MTATPEGALHLTDEGRLLRVDREGQVSIVARDLIERSWTQFHVSRRHSLMGLWMDPPGNVLLASWGGRRVLRIAPDGKVSVVARSGLGWGPTGGLAAPDGALWILETSLTNAVRVRRIGRDGRSRTW
jgi:streptogramin lyase